MNKQEKRVRARFGMLFDESVFRKDCVYNYRQFKDKIYVKDEWGAEHPFSKQEFDILFIVEQRVTQVDDGQ